MSEDPLMTVETAMELLACTITQLALVRFDLTLHLTGDVDAAHDAALSVVTGTYGKVLPEDAISGLRAVIVANVELARTQARTPGQHP